MRNIILLFILSGVYACVPIDSGSSSGSSRSLTMEDHTYEWEIRTVRLHPNKGTLQATQLPSVVPLNQQDLVLSFDDLTKDNDTYNVKIIHCQADWRPSGISSMEYIDGFNEYPITQYEFSIDTKIPYIHYRFAVPAVKLPGNYLLKVYRGTNEQEVVLTRRFMVFDNSIRVGIEEGAQGISSAPGQSHQAFFFSLFFRDLQMVNPSEQIKVTLRQNQRWDNAITHLKPTFFKEDVGQLDYRHFTQNGQFLAGNEFRFFDMRSVRYPGQNVWRMNYETEPYQAIIGRDRPRGTQAYSQYRDMNGNFLNQNLEPGATPNSSEYVQTFFTLDTGEKLPGEVYLFGALTHWSFGEEGRMQYDPESKTYGGSVLLKQGWYDYQYLVKSDSLPINHLEGNHFQSENAYEILVYYRPVNGRADLLLGYLRFERNARN
jgi:hypothetical protein